MVYFWLRIIVLLLGINVDCSKDLVKKRIVVDVDAVDVVDVVVSIVSSI